MYENTPLVLLGISKWTTLWSAIFCSIKV
jgi:hypothetical protein